MFPMRTRDECANYTYYNIMINNNIIYTLPTHFNYYILSYDNDIILLIVFFFCASDREFYYIQMEKYARQAVSEGLQRSEDIHVNKDSEIYRVLNLHYNRNNHIEVCLCRHHKNECIYCGIPEPVMKPDIFFLLTLAIIF